MMEEKVGFPQYVIGTQDDLRLKITDVTDVTDELAKMFAPEIQEIAECHSSRGPQVHRLI